MTKDAIDVALVQELWIYRCRVKGLRKGGTQIIYDTSDGNPKTCVIANRNVKLIPLWEFYIKNLVAATLLVTKAGCKRKVIVGSAYFPYDQQADPPPKCVRRLIRYYWKKMVLECDVKEHHII